jgi:CRISPR-associated endonuclease/helicase Cas3
MNYYFRTAAEKFRLVDDDWQQAVIVPYGKAMELVGELSETPWNAHKILRRLQRYAVNISLRLFETLACRGYVRELDGYPGLFLLDFSLYHDIFGFVPPEESLGADPEKFMV